MRSLSLYLQIRNSIDSEVISLINHREFVKELMDYLEFLLMSAIHTMIIIPFSM